MKRGVVAGAPLPGGVEFQQRDEFPITYIVDPDCL
jgi:hypothetical protein